MCFTDRQPDLVAVVILHVAEELAARTVKHRDAFAAPDTNHLQGMTRLTVSQKKSRPLALAGWKVETVHGGSGSSH